MADSTELVLPQGSGASLSVYDSAVMARTRRWPVMFANSETPKERRAEPNETARWAENPPSREEPRPAPVEVRSW